MSLHWQSGGEFWEPEGGEKRPWREVGPGDLIAFDRRVWRVIENRPDPVADWDEDDRSYFRSYGPNSGISEEAWPYRPLCLVVEPASGGEQEHLEVKPYRGLRSRAFIVPAHYPVCSECGQPWPCRELDIDREVKRQAEEIERRSSLVPGCCWDCGEPVTSRQLSIRFDGENLLMPGGPPVAFHLRAAGTCWMSAYQYEQRWVGADLTRKWRLQCPGTLTRHLDGAECTSGPDCPGAETRHNTDSRHLFRQIRSDGPTVYEPIPGSGAADCLRCLDAARRRDVLGEAPPGALL